MNPKLSIDLTSALIADRHTDAAHQRMVDLAQTPHARPNLADRRWRQRRRLRDAKLAVAEVFPPTAASYSVGESGNGGGA